MSNSRQPAAQVRSYSITHPQGRVLLPTQPGWDYLVFARSGVFTALTDTQAWTVPAHRALCVPDGTRLQIKTTRRVAMRCLYFDQRLDVIGPELRVVRLAPLTRELVTHAVATAPLRVDDRPHEALVTLLAARLASEPDAPLDLVLPTDNVALGVATSIMSDPALPLDQHLLAAHATRRTIERRFRSETLMSLGQWRRRARVLAAVAMLAQGDNVTRVAGAVGYASPSSFVAAFRSEFGVPPRAFTDGRPAD